MPGEVHHEASTQPERSEGGGRGCEAVFSTPNHDAHTQTTEPSTGGPCHLPRGLPPLLLPDAGDQACTGGLPSWDWEEGRPELQSSLPRAKHHARPYLLPQLTNHLAQQHHEPEVGQETAGGGQVCVRDTSRPAALHSGKGGYICSQGGSKAG